MKLIKDILNKFTPLEIIVLMVSITISTFLIVPIFTGNEQSNHNVAGDALFPTEKVYSIEGGKPVDLFDTTFYVYYEESRTEEKAEVVNVLNEYLVKYHILFDRHHDYFAVDPVDPLFPTETEKTTLPRVHNLKYINDHQGEVIEIEKPLFDLLSISKEHTINTPMNAFSMFIGGLYDFWKPHTNYAVVPGEEVEGPPAVDPLVNETSRLEVERLQSYIPLTATDIENTLKLWEENNKYYVTFNEFNGSGPDLSISVGAVAKGMMTDVLSEALLAKGLSKGFINGGTSSFTFLEKGFGGKAYNINMANIEYLTEVNKSYSFSRFDKYQMSTSGIYAGFRFTYNNEIVIRSHIIDPLSGYPAQQKHQAVNIASNTLSGLELDYLTTTLSVLSEEEGMNYLRANYASHDVNIAFIGKDASGYYVAHTKNYPGGNDAKMTVVSPYREIFLDFLQ